MKKRYCRIAGVVLLLAAIVFVGYALGHPEASFPWSNGVTYGIYGAYLLLVLCLLIAPVEKKRS